jgi:hypothetical protein
LKYKFYISWFLVHARIFHPFLSFNTACTNSYQYAHSFKPPAPSRGADSLFLDQYGSVNQLYQVFAIPTVLFIDGDGVIRAKIIEKVTPEILEEKLPLIGIDL